MIDTLIPSKREARKTDTALWIPLGIGSAVAALMVSIFDKGWLPHDDGYIAWAASETLSGGMPHRDFHEVYTGGLSYFNSWAFQLFGESVLALRIPYLVFFAAFGLVLYLVARRFLAPVVSALAVGSVVLLGPALTPTPMPTLYNLFFGTFALYLTIRYMEGGRATWLVAAGLITGISVLVKVTGLYVLLAIPLGLIAYHGSQRSSSADTVSRLLLWVGAAVPTVMIVLDFTLSRFVGLLVPLYIVVWCIWNVRAPLGAGDSSCSTLGSIAAFSIGAVVPLAAYAWYFATNGALKDLIQGISASTSAVVGELGFDLAHISTIAIPLGLAGICVVLARLSRAWGEKYVVGGIAAFVLLCYVVAPRNELLAIHGVTRWITLAACIGLVMVIRSDKDRISLDPRLMMLASVVACFQLVQFPSSNQWQVAYTVPLAGVLLVSLLSRVDRRTFVTSIAVLVSLAIVFGLARFEGQVFAGSDVGLRVPFVQLEGEYGGILIPVVHEYYNDVVTEISSRPHSELLMAGPDSPEIYFLTNRKGSYPGVFPVLDVPIDPDFTMLGEFEANTPDIVVVDVDPAVSDLDDDLVERVGEQCLFESEMGPLLLFVGCNRAS